MVVLHVLIHTFSGCNFKVHTDEAPQVFPSVLIIALLLEQDFKQLLLLSLYKHILYAEVGVIINSLF